MMSKKVMLTDTKEAFIGVNENPIFGEGSKSIHKCLRCSSGLVLATRGSSMYTTSEQTSEWHSSSWKEFCINPNEMVTAVLWTSAGATGIWWYVHTMLSFEWRDTPSSKLSLYFDEPGLRVCRPEGWQLHSDSCKGRSGGKSSRVFDHLESCVQLSFGVTNVVFLYHHYMNDGSKLLRQL